jgi:hypothetical protein
MLKKTVHHCFKFGFALLFFNPLQAKGAAKLFAARP